MRPRVTRGRFVLFFCFRLGGNADLARTLVNQIEAVSRGLKPLCATFDGPIRFRFGQRAEKSLNERMQSRWLRCGRFWNYTTAFRFLWLVLRRTATRSGWRDTANNWFDQTLIAGSEETSVCR